MKNFVKNGYDIVITAGADIVSGQGVLTGSLFGVAVANIANGASGPVKTTGVFDLPKVGSQAWSVGALVYWNGTACTTTASTNKLIGVAIVATGSGAGETTGRVRLNGAAVN